MFQRIIKISELRSFFLFGARATGKSTLLKERFKNQNVLWVDLLDPTWERLLARNPEALSAAILKLNGAGPKWVVIDEVQKIPQLLDVVHSSIFQGQALFALTGSSARKLKNGGANLLAGRALTHSLFPVSFVEIADKFDLIETLTWGALPEIYSLIGNQIRTQYLNSYCQTYLKEEVFAEQLIRNIAPFKNFIELAARENGHILNFQSIARNILVDGKTIASYYSILEDTLLGFLLYPSGLTIRNRQSTKPKFYFFDLGVQRALAGVLDIMPKPRTSYFGELFEHLVILEAYKLNSYFECGFRFSYYYSHSGLEIDLVLEKTWREPIFIEIKSTSEILECHLKALKILQLEMPKARFVCLSLDPIERTHNGIELIPWKAGLLKLLSRDEG